MSQISFQARRTLPASMKRGVMELWSGVMEYWSGGVVEWWSGGVVE
jgi:hypothetical protein